MSPAEKGDHPFKRPLPYIDNGLIERQIAEFERDPLLPSQCRLKALGGNQVQIAHQVVQLSDREYIILNVYRNHIGQTLQTREIFDELMEYEVFDSWKHQKGSV